MALLLSALLTATGAATTLLVSGPTASAVPVGDCTTSTGAIVAVDFSHWGGPVARGCDTTLTTGMDLLHDAGFTTTGTQHDGPGFICRIGDPDFSNGTQYPTAADEPCVQTPQATAYWSYWIALKGQRTWTYSPLGAMSDVPKPGEVEAWVYGGTDIGGTSGAPGFTPDSVRATDPTTSPTPSATPTTDAPTDTASPSTPPTGSGSGSPTGDHLKAASAWLVQQLNGDDHVGGDSPDYLTTTATGLALAASGDQDPILTRLVAFLKAHATDFAFPNGTTAPPDPYAVSDLALLAEATGSDPTAFGSQNLLTDLTGNVCTAQGSLGNCTGPGDFYAASYPSTQAQALLALARADVTPPAAAVSRLESAQCADGGFSPTMLNSGDPCSSDTVTTAQAALALSHLPDTADKVASALSYLKDQQQSDGSFLAYVGEANPETYATTLVQQTLHALGSESAAAAAQDWLLGRQDSDGGFNSDVTSTISDPYLTALATLTLADTDLGSVRHDLGGTTTAPPTTAPPTTVPPTTAPPSATPPTGKAPDLAKGSAYLTAPANLIDGDYYEAFAGSGFADFGLTIDGAFALAATGADNPSLAKIVNFLGSQGKDGSGRTVNDWTGVGTQYAGGGSIGKEALLAEATGKDPHAFGGHDLIAALDKAVCTKASTAPDASCAAAGNYTYATSTFSQALGVIAQLRVDDSADAAAPIAYLESLQNKDGAWPSLIPSTGDSDVDSTAMAVMALSIVPGDTARAATARGLTWITAQQEADGGFPGAAGDSTNSAALAVQALTLDGATHQAAINTALAFLAGQQNSDGGFNVASSGQRGSDVRASTQVVGGATGISFATLTRNLTGVTPPPNSTATATATNSTPANPTGTPSIINVGPTDPESTGAATAGGVLAHTGSDGLTRIGALGALLLLAGASFLTVTRRRTAAKGRHQ